MSDDKVIYKKRAFTYNPTSTIMTEHEIANPSDFFVKRDGDGNLKPVVQQIPGVEQSLRVIPMTKGQVHGYGIDNGDFSDVTDEDLARIFNNHLADLDEHLEPEDVSENMIGFGKTALLKTILRASGFDMQQAINKENLEMLGDLDEGNLEKLIKLQNKQDKHFG